jgi:CubicO group peptidase (beta-lactamase class C family)
MTVPLWDRALPPSLESVATTYEATRAPGISPSYSNAAFAILGRVVEVVSGQSFPEYVQANVLHPLDMHDTTVVPTARTVERLALPYQRTPTGLEPLRQVRFDVYPAGEFLTTAPDMARFLALHLNGGALGGIRVLSAESASEMHRRQFFRDQGHSGYGLGFWVEDEGPDHHVISHSGSVPGLVAQLRGDLDAKVGIYLLANLDGGHRTLEAIARIAITLLRGETYVGFDPVLARRSPVPAAWDAYVGTYLRSTGAPARVRVETSALRLEVEGATFWLVPKEGDAFDARGDDAPDGFDVTFTRDAQGAVAGIRGPSGDVAPRVAVDAPPSMDLSKPPEGELVGAWAGFARFGGLKVDFAFRVEKEAGGLAGTVTLGAQGLQDSPVQRLMHHGRAVHFEHGAGDALATVDGVLDGDTLRGTIRRMGLRLPVEAFRVGTEAARRAAAERDAVGTPK